MIRHLPRRARDHYLQAFTNALHSVFLVAAAAAVAAFVLTWFIPELPLRETVTTGDMGDTFATPRGTDSLAEIAVNKIGRLDRREGAREIVRRVAARAGVDLQPAACWLLARFTRMRRPTCPLLAERIEHRSGNARRCAHPAA